MFQMSEDLPCSDVALTSLVLPGPARPFCLSSLSYIVEAVVGVFLLRNRQTTTTHRSPEAAAAVAAAVGEQVWQIVLFHNVGDLERVLLNTPPDPT